MRKGEGRPNGTSWLRPVTEGHAAAWEDYKPRLRDHAFGLLCSGDWLEVEIGSGAILNRTVEAIEIQGDRLNLTNNLVFWQNRFGHANRDHRAMLEAASNPRHCTAFRLRYGRTIQKSRLPGINPRYCPVIDHFSAPWANRSQLLASDQHEPS